MGKPKSAIMWFAWRPIRTTDTNKIVWLKRVYREWWYSRLYFEAPDFVKPSLTLPQRCAVKPKSQAGDIS